MRLRVRRKCRPNTSNHSNGIVDLQADINRYLAEINANPNPNPFTSTSDPDAIIEKVRRGKQVLVRVDQLARQRAGFSNAGFPNIA